LRKVWRIRPQNDFSLMKCCDIFAVMICYDLFSVLTCPTVPVITNAWSNSTNAIYGTVVNYTCKKGHIFPNNASRALIKCTDNGNWSEALHNCTGNHTGNSMKQWLILPPFWITCYTFVWLIFKLSVIGNVTDPNS
jgi:hypothetical protein